MQKNSDFLVNLNSIAYISTTKSADLTILVVATLATWFIELKSLVVRYFSYANRYKNNRYSIEINEIVKSNKVLTR